MSDILSCLPQSKHLLDLYGDVSDVGLISRMERPKALIDHIWETPEYDFSENAPMYIKARVSEL
ncbi:hypothetical protein [Psychrobacter arcticus]|uniref:hypothetical protein n=1 Tax=Psychrobacter arcticus TaxID=334543 RepID=UPI0002F66950|nr:hypothetical protein [Psychrobacter arcticus]